MSVQASLVSWSVHLLRARSGGDTRPMTNSSIASRRRADETSLTSPSQTAATGSRWILVTRSRRCRRTTKFFESISQGPDSVADALIFVMMYAY